MGLQLKRRESVSVRAFLKKTTPLNGPRPKLGNNIVNQLSDKGKSLNLFTALFTFFSRGGLLFGAELL